jgi:hypothetical protein
LTDDEVALAEYYMDAIVRLKSDKQIVGEPEYAELRVVV